MYVSLALFSKALTDFTSLLNGPDIHHPVVGLSDIHEHNECKWQRPCERFHRQV